MKKWAPALGALALQLAACSAQPGSHDAPDGSEPSSSPPSPTADDSVGATVDPAADDPSSTGHSTPLTGRVLVTASGDVGPIALSGTTVAYPYADGSPEWNTVRITKDGATRTAARSEWSEGMINWAALSGRHLAYVDQSRQQNDGSMDVLWRVWAVDLKDESRTLLASNGDTPDPFVPTVDGGGGFFFWSQAEKDRSAAEFAWRPGWQEPRSLLRYAVLAPGSETFCRNGVVYLGPNG